MGPAHEVVVIARDDAINGGDLDALAELMTDDHRFGGPAGAVVDGRPVCIEAWRWFFAAFPDHRNVLTMVVRDDAGVVDVVGHSTVGWRCGTSSTQPTAEAYRGHQADQGLTTSSPSNRAKSSAFLADQREAVHDGRPPMKASQ